MKQEKTFNQNEVVTYIKKQAIVTFRDLVRFLKLDSAYNRDFSYFLSKLVESNVIAKTKGGDYYVPHRIKLVKGKFSLNQRGFGFVDWVNKDGSKESVFIGPNHINEAMNDDEVEVEVFARPNEVDFQYGLIIRIIKRAHLMMVGKVLYDEHNKLYSFKPTNARIVNKIIFNDLNNIEPNKIIKVKITTFTKKALYVDHVATLGSVDDSSIDILAAIEDARVPYIFGEATMREAAQLPKQVLPNEVLARKDLREALIVTIDGDDTKDFDDAIEVRLLPNGNYLLSVHIADVAHYVTEDSAIDQEALKRGTSIYLVDRVIPMLPEALSNEICSLKPHEDRLCLSVDIEIAPNGKNVKYEIYESIINSKYRLTYKEVNAFFHSGINKWDNPALEQMLTTALQLSKIIRSYKNDQGYIDFEINESKIIVNEKGKTTNIVLRDRLESEMLIEDFMVRANEVIARHVEKQELPFIYRVHDKPNLEAVNNLQSVVKVLGLTTYIPHNAVPREFARSINEIKATRFDDFMKVMMLRSMAKAEYSDKNIGHFGLASKSYTHFTSPIRRYPDLMVHRMLKAYRMGNNVTDAANHFRKILGSIAAFNSQSEVKATELERQIDDIKKAEFYERFIDQGFEGTIVTIAAFGFFVDFPNKVGGLVHISSLLDGPYTLVNSGYTLKGLKRSFTIGDVVRVVVHEIIKDEGKINLVIEDMYPKLKRQAEL